MRNPYKRHDGCYQSHKHQKPHSFCVNKLNKRLHTNTINRCRCGHVYLRNTFLLTACCFVEGSWSDMNALPLHPPISRSLRQSALLRLCVVIEAVNSFNNISCWCVHFYAVSFLQPRCFNLELFIYIFCFNIGHFPHKG